MSPGPTSWTPRPTWTPRGARSTRTPRGGAAYQIMDGLCSGDGFWYFQPCLIRQGREWYEHAARDPDNLADVPGVRALAGRSSRAWPDAPLPWRGKLAYVARRVHDYLTGQQDSICHALAERGLRSPQDPAPADRPWDFDSPAEIQRRLPRITEMFPRQHCLRDWAACLRGAFLRPCTTALPRRAGPPRSSVTARTLMPGPRGVEADHIRRLCAPPRSSNDYTA